jgi:hypothetical protein
LANGRSDHDLIGDVLIRYATGIDTKNWSLFRTCFTNDVIADYGDIGVWKGVDEITEYMATVHAGMPKTNHMMSNFSIELDGNHASATSYVHVILVLADAPLMWIEAVGEYVDKLVRAADGWRIRERRYSTSRLLASDPALLEHRG